MKLTYDSKYNIAYFRLHKKVKDVQTIKVSEELNIDLSTDGTIYGIEFLNANEQLSQEDDGKLIVINEKTGKREEIKLI